MSEPKTWNVDPANPLPLYYQVYASLLERIQVGEFPPGSFLPAERQLTEDYGVSRITIIKALNELSRERHIKRQQGRGTMVTHPADRRGGQRRSIAFICHILDHPYLFHVLMGIARTAAENHHDLQVISSYDADDDEAQHIREAIVRNVDGIIVFPHHRYRNQALYEDLQRQRFPLVMVDRYYPQIDTDRVVFDDEIAGYELTSRLLHRGRRRIAVISYFEVEATSVNHRLSGYRRALQEAGLPYDEDLVWLDVYQSFHRPDELLSDVSARERLSKRLAQLEPDALLTLNDDVLERVTYDLLILSHSVLPVSATDRKRASAIHWTGDIATFSHKPPTPYAPYHSLAAVHSGEMLGSEATRLLIARTNRKLGEERQVIMVPMTIVESESDASQPPMPAVADDAPV
ncbi:MAG TPA: GntR family transcriptional regulator [Candidatus Dormibacteraeota bacterium]|jgi:DNA-binding LacI/PurR family transcriptional regulator|nr:GntR family transcriptional regulator [Candidatus Dormibacteraeota bacterium]